MNYGALTVWNQLNRRPHFVKAFKSISQLKTLLTETLIYERYFAYNIYENAYKDQAKVEKSILKGLSADSIKAIYSDDAYGFSKANTLFQWVIAMNKGSASREYQNILTHFKDEVKLADFSETTMD